MLRKLESCLKKVVSPISDRLRDISMVMVVLIVLLVVADVCARRIFNSPIRGTNELTSLAFSLMTFLPLAWCAFMGSHVEIDIAVKKLPKTPRLVIEAVIMFITTGMLGMMSWRLFVYGTILQAANVKSSLLSIILYPFLYIAAFGSLMVALAFFIRFIGTLNTLVEGRQ
jgi:TRAP-type C4-dicarboxylate transport system permease small subunit